MSEHILKIISILSFVLDPEECQDSSLLFWTSNFM